MMILIHSFICFLVILQFNSNTVLGQRSFANPAVTDPAPCACDLAIGACDANCCCDADCEDSDLTASPTCKGTRTVSSYSASEEQSLKTWNCSNGTSAALYDYFPFVCVQLKLNEVIGEFYSTDNVTFQKTSDNVTNLRSTFITEHPELFEATTLSSTTVSTINYSIGTPIRVQSGAVLTLPGNLAGSACQNAVPVLFGVNRDITCSSITPFDLCNTTINLASVWIGGGSSSTTNITFYSSTYNSGTNTTINPTTEYYFQDPYSLNIGGIPYTNIAINDYCPNRHPLTRTQRYLHACTSAPTDNCTNQFQVWNACQSRDNLSYTTINETYFTTRTSSTDDSTSFSDFDNATLLTNPIASTFCANNDTRRVFYRFNYSSDSNTISNVEVFILTDSGSGDSFVPRITIQWNDNAVNQTTNTTIPRGYSDGEVLQFQRNGVASDVSTLVPTSSGYCVDATPTTLRYKQSTSSYCFIQLQQSTIQQCHNLKLNMYLYLNVFYAPASHVLAYPSSSATLVQIRDNNQDSLDLDRIDVTRPNNRLTSATILSTTLYTSTPTIYDTTAILPICFDVPSGIYIEFGYVRVQISPTVSFERIVSVRYNYTYSNWQFDCNQASCANDSTQKYLVTFQSAFVDYTNSVLNLTELTRGDITSADNYIQHLLWLITPEYKGEPAYRNYTIAMILIFIAISVVVVHVLLFGLTCPF